MFGLYCIPSLATPQLTDFGLAQKRLPNAKLTKICGTWAYAAPEMHQANRPGYDERFDMWSFGVILFIVLAGALQARCYHHTLHRSS